ncbi:hypothetical protein ACI2OX_21420 [Bacillus sp. N9]
MVPSHILLESIDGWIWEGYDAERIYSKRAANIWWKAWSYLQIWIRDKNITSIDELDRGTRGIINHYFSNWVQDFDMALTNAGNHNKQFNQMRLTYAEEFLKLFPNSKYSLIRIMVTAKGESLFYLGKWKRQIRFFKIL